jgi:hypothetical protein
MLRLWGLRLINRLNQILYLCYWHGSLHRDRHNQDMKRDIFAEKLKSQCIEVQYQLAHRTNVDPQLQEHVN